MRRALKGGLALALLALLSAPAGPVRAQGEAEVRATGAVPLVVDGVRVTPPVQVRLGAVVCAPETHYIGPGERFRFLRWSIERDGSVERERSLCVTVQGPWVYEAQMERQALVQVFAEPVSRYSWTRWVRRGTAVVLEVPEVVQVDEWTRYRFVRWSDGETPLQPRNRVAALGRVQVRVQWEREFRVEVKGPEGALLGDPSGWYPEGAVLTLRAREALEAGEGPPLRFMGWEVTLGPEDLPARPEVEVTVRGPLSVSARYSARPPVQEETGEVRATGPVAVQVNGEPVSALPAPVRVGDEVCASPFYYTQVGERYRFLGWRIHGAGPSGPRRWADLCVRVTGPWTYEARLERQVLFLVDAGPVREQTWSRWVPYGQVVELEVPGVVEVDGGVRYRFLGWSLGERPFSPSNRVAALAPTQVQVRWQREFRVKVQAPEGALLGDPSGWYPENAPLVLRVREALPLEEGVRLRFAGWEVVRGPLVLPPQPEGEALFTVTGPLTLSARYEKEYRVVVRALGEVLVDGWFPEGATVSASAEPVREVVPQEERYVFRAWEGLPEPVPGPDLRFTVTGPAEVVARYERQYRVEVVAPYGGVGSGWYPAGGEAVVEVPRSPQTLFLFRREFQGFVGYPEAANRLRLQVDRPITLTAVYRTGLDGRAVAMTGAVLGVGLLAYLAMDVLPRLRSRRRGGEPSPPPAPGSVQDTGEAER